MHACTRHTRQSARREARGCTHTKASLQPHVPRCSTQRSPQSSTEEREEREESSCSATSCCAAALPRYRASPRDWATSCGVSASSAACPPTAGTSTPPPAATAPPSSAQRWAHACTCVYARTCVHARTRACATCCACTTCNMQHAHAHVHVHVHVHVLHVAHVACCMCMCVCVHARWWRAVALSSQAGAARGATERATARRGRWTRPRRRATSATARPQANIMHT